MCLPQIAAVVGLITVAVFSSLNPAALQRPEVFVPALPPLLDSGFSHLSLCLLLCPASTHPRLAEGRPFASLIEKRIVFSSKRFSTAAALFSPACWHIT